MILVRLHPASHTCSTNAVFGTVQRTVYHSYRRLKSNSKEVWSLFRVDSRTFIMNSVRI